MMRMDANMSQSLKSYIRSVAATACNAANYPLARLKGKIIILMYHRVLTEKDIARQFIEPGMYVKKDVFEMQIKYLREHFQILQFRDLMDLWTEEAVDENRRYCVITFDDGWLDNYINAFPILKKYNAPATIFLATDFVGTSRWFWPDRVAFLLNYYFKEGVGQGKEEIMKRFPGNHALARTSIEKADFIIKALKSWPDEDINYLIGSIIEELDIKIPDERILLNWKEIEEMSQYGVSFGSHSCSHRILTRLNIEDVSREAEKSMRIINEKGINHIPVFCYPNGNFNCEIAESIRNAGFHAAVTTSFGFEGAFPSDIFGIRRVGIHNDISSSIPLFGMRISGLDRIRR